MMTDDQDRIAEEEECLRRDEEDRLRREEEDRRRRNVPRVKTTDEILGKVMLVLTRQIALGPDDACSRCGTRLSALYALYLAVCGRDCPRGCAKAQADMIAATEVVTKYDTDWREHYGRTRLGLTLSSLPGDEDKW